MRTTMRRFCVCAAILGAAMPAAEALAVNNGDVPVNTATSARRMIEHLNKTYGPKYKGGKAFLSRLAAIEVKLKSNASDSAANADLKELIREASLANPLLDMDKLLIIRRKGEANRSLNSHTTATINPWRGRGRRRANAPPGWDNEITELSDLRGEVKARTVFRHPGGSVIKHMELHFDARKIMFSGGGSNKAWAVLEIDADGKDLRELTPSDQPDVQWFDACYLPEKDYIVTASTAGMQGLPCENGGKPMVNLYKVNTKTKQVRQLTFEQDSDWHPRVHHNGRILYLRWEYTDIPHYYSRYMFHMNPDGTGQMEYWGSGSYFPTAYCWARPVPNHSTMIVGTVSGHHAKSETGRLLLIDPALGRKYPFRYRHNDKSWGAPRTVFNVHPKPLPASETGCVQEVPGWGRDVVGNVYDNQGGGQKYTFQTPWPLSDKYFLVSLKGFTEDSSKWTLCLVDAFDNMTTIYADKDYDIFEPMPMAPRKTPPVLPDRTRKGAPATIFCTDLYGGRGMKGVPRGTVKELRVFAYHYGYIRSGGHASVGLESSWDIKRILGTVPVESDGSFSFEAPPNTPLAIQPLDSDGAAVALMRSWIVGMPGENLACNGCHEDQNEVTPSKFALAGRRAPHRIKPWFGSKRPFCFATEIQPLLRKYCLSCHDDTEKKGGISFEKDTPGRWNSDRSYLSLVAFVRRPGPESDMDMLQPMEYHASTSQLVRMFKKGHNGVELADKDWRQLYTWIDLNAPHRGAWNNERYEKRRLDLAVLYAGLTDNPEEEYRQALAFVEKQTVRPVKPKRTLKPEPDNLDAAGFPFDAAKAKALQGANASFEVTLADGLTMKFVRIPAGSFVMGSQAGYADEAPRAVVSIDKPFWMGVTEVTNRQYEAFDPKHDTRYIDEHGKDHATPGYIANHYDQPVARISWVEATAFCDWLSKKTGKTATLPTEAQWEWAARGGSDSPFFYGDKDTDFSPFANLADTTRSHMAGGYPGGSKLRDMNPYPDKSLFPLRDIRFKDNWFIVDYVARCKPNPFGLYDIVGNVSEWTRSDYTSYPYRASDGRNAGNAKAPKVARGGSWDDRPKDAGSSVRFRYESFQKVYDVGFRVIIED